MPAPLLAINNNISQQVAGLYIHTACLNCQGVFEWGRHESERVDLMRSKDVCFYLLLVPHYICTSAGCLAATVMLVYTPALLSCKELCHTHNCVYVCAPIAFRRACHTPAHSQQSACLGLPICLPMHHHSALCYKRFSLVMVD